MMRKMMTMIMLLLFFELSAPPAAYYPIILVEEPLNNLEAIWQAIIMVESGGNPDAWVIDTNGKPSIGISQIQQSRVEHFNRLTGKNYSHEDCFCPEISKEIFFYYARQIGNEEAISRCWNGGPMGMSKESTVQYWEKIKRYL